jgi:hypothetical protein
MPIEDIHFDQEIVSSKVVGQVDRADADKWVIAIQRFVEMKRGPIIALMDALEATFVTVSARVVFAQTSRNANLIGLIVAADNSITVQSFRVTGMLGEQGHTFIFTTLDEARQFAKDRIRGISTA